MSQNFILALYQGNYARQTGATESGLDPKYSFFFFFSFWLQKPRARNVNWLCRSMSILVPKFHLISSLSGTYTAGASRDDLRHAGTMRAPGRASCTRLRATASLQPWRLSPDTVPPATATNGFCRKAGCSSLLHRYPNQRAASQSITRAISLQCLL